MAIVSGGGDELDADGRLTFARCQKGKNSSTRAGMAAPHVGNWGKAPDPVWDLEAGSCRAAGEREPHSWQLCGSEGQRQGQG